MIAALAPITTPSVDWLAIAPELALGGAAVLIVLARALLRRHPAATAVTYVIATLGVLTTAGLLVWQWHDVQDHGAISTMGGMVRVDPFGVFLGIVVVIATAMALLIVGRVPAPRAARGARIRRADALLGASGMLTMTTANDLIVVFIALEILSIPLYVLAAFDRRRLELAGSRHQVLRARRVLLRDLPLRHRARSTAPPAPRRSPGSRCSCGRTPSSTRAPCWPGSRCCSWASAFKVAAVPFHMWTPDVYEGAPSPVTAFMASATKAAGFAALLRIFGVAFLNYRTDWQPIVWALAALTLVFGSIGDAAPDRPQADARLLVDRPRRLRADGAADGHAARPRGGALLPVRLHVHGGRVVRGGHRAQREG